VFVEALAMTGRSSEVQSHAAGLYREERAGIAALLRAGRGEPHEKDDLLASMLQAIVDGLIIQALVSGDEAASPREVLQTLAPLILGTASVSPASPHGAT
jgi:hypothetical protein